jgi:hypothetical protein
MTELDDIWLNAWARYLDVAAGIVDVNDRRPSLELLLSSVPMPQGAQDMLKNLLFPHDPPSDAFILKAERNPKFDRMLGELDVVHAYTEKRKARVPFEKAAREAIKEAGKSVQPEEIRRYRARLRALGRYLRGQ